MGGWIAMILLALVLLAALFPFARRDKGALQFLAAALLLALAGYAWQGRPDEPGSPKKAEAAAGEGVDDDFAVLRPDLLGRFDRDSYWMTLADAERKRGNPRGAAEILQAAVQRNPRSYSLWIAYGYALVANGDVATPASELAFQRAGQLAPDNPGPTFFHALALTREVRLEAYQRAFDEWRQLLPNVPESSQYHAAITERMEAVQQAAAAGTAVAPAPPPQPRPQSPAPSAPVTVGE
jgi:cytochrome c-type biogenesis protein CcmH/NrfG